MLLLFLKMCKITSQESETNSEYKVYKLNTYVNSDKNPFGLTLKGRTKEYILAHETFQHLIVKRKKYFVGKGFFKVVDPNQRPAMVNAILEVSEREMLRSKSTILAIIRRKAPP